MDNILSKYILGNKSEALNVLMLLNLCNYVELFFHPFHFDGKARDKSIDDDLRK